jgi:hypothetical protein
MDDENQLTTQTFPRQEKLIRSTFTILLLAWLLCIVAMRYGARLNSRMSGPNDDVHDSISRAWYISQQLLPFDCAVLSLDLCAGFVLFALRSSRPLGKLGIALAAFWLASTLLHGIVLSLDLLMAG